MVKFLAYEHDVKSVTVFKSSLAKAEIVRVFSVTLQKGQTKVQVTGLPAIIDPRSVRVTGVDFSRLKDVVCTQSSERDPTDASEAIRRLVARRHSIEAEKNVRLYEAQLLVDYGQTLTGEHVGPNVMDTFLDAFLERGKKNVQCIAQLDEQLHEIDKAIEIERKKTSSRKGPSPTGEVTIVVDSEAVEEVQLSLTYLVGRASWEPTYELHATTSDGKPSPTVSLNYCARITQSTGEDWSNCTLTLSTFDASTSSTIPKMTPIKIRQVPSSTNNIGFGAYSNAAFGSNNTRAPIFGAGQQNVQAGSLFGGAPAQQVASTTAGLFGQAATGPPQAAAPPTQQMAVAPGATSKRPVTQSTFKATTTDDESEGELVELESPAKGFTSVVKESALAVSFTVDNTTCSIPSDGIAHTVTLAHLTFSSTVRCVAVPRVVPTAFISCEVKNTSSYRLLPGPVAVILDGGYVSHTSISDIAPGALFSCTLGADPSTHVTYTRNSNTTKSEVGTFAEASNLTTVKVKVSVENKHTFDLEEVLVKECLPTIERGSGPGNVFGKVRVVLRKPAGLADTKDGEEVKAGEDSWKVRWEKVANGKGGEKDGSFEWFGGIGAGKKVDLEAQWEIKAPEDLKWSAVLAK